MSKNTTINIVGVLVLIAVVVLGYNIYQKAESPGEAPNVKVDSTGGTLTVTEIPVTETTPTEQKENITQLKPSPTPEKNMNKVTMDTNFGEIVLELYTEDAPKAASNFATLASKGFYDNLIFHRVISGFMIQGGDPLGTGTGGPGYQFADELDPNTPSAKAGYKKGVLAMANSGPNTNGSQFFIMLADYPLPHNYTIFGHVISGQEVVDKIGAVKTDGNDRPLTPVVMKTVTVGERL